MTSSVRPTTFILMAVAFMTIWQTLTGALKPEVLIPILLAGGLAGAFPAFRWLWRAWRVRYPFKMRFSNSRYHDPVKSPPYPRRAFFQVDVPKILTLRLIVKHAMDVEKFNVRFIEKKGLLRRPKDVIGNRIKIVSATNPQWADENDITIEGDMVGGFYLKPKTSKRLVINQQVWLECSVQAAEFWDGYISVETWTRDRRVKTRKKVTAWYGAGEISEP